MFTMEIGGVRYRMDPAAVSALRYRAEYGKSIVTALADCADETELEGQLLRMCYCMLSPVAHRPELLDFARSARRDEDFLSKAILARDLLLSPDPGTSARADDSGAGPFDEYQVLAVLSALGIDLSLIYELPILHLVGLAQRAADLRDPDRRTYRPMDDTEMAALYPGEAMSVADFNVVGLDDLMRSIEEMAEIPEAVFDDMLRAKAEVVVDAQKKMIDQVTSPDSSGQLWDSITVGRTKWGSAYGRDKTYFTYVYPSGKRKDAKPTNGDVSRRRKRKYGKPTNGDVGFILEYGAPQRGIAPRSWMRLANCISEDAAREAAAKIHSEWLKEIGL